ncbi:hypothetical protein QBC46DRAFT_458630 [Diplogelasinospora grovesii]|uniref:Myb-like domain-containing protein n=1 Tax=Diplogelasinospora grovesii TaxID=303347 RepID=A0AAN6N886_9PEZI|nr:hypothetical protein QBC46DRAFT_458630 [Diplogelasinospora grovesii]
MQRRITRKQGAHLFGESDSDDEAGPPLAKPKSGRRRNVIGHGVHRSLRNSRVDPKDRDEVMQQSDGQDSRRRYLCRRRRSNREDEDDEQDDDIRPPQRKRLKTSSPAQPTLRTSTRRRTRSKGGTSGSHQVQTSAPGRERSGRRSIPSPPSSQGSGDEEVSVQVPMAKFEEWPLDDVVLKRVTANGLAAFQLQFYQSPVKRRTTTKRGASIRARFTPEEDDLLVKLKNQGLPWQGIHKKFTDAFPQRERRVGSLQVRYCTKLKGGD